MLCRWPHLEIQGDPNDSSTDYDIAVRRKKFLFHKGSPLVIIGILLQTTPKMWPKYRKCTSDSSGDVTWRFQCKFPIHLWLIYLTSFLDESSTLRCFTIVKIGRWHHLKAFLFVWSRGCFHFSKIYCKSITFWKKKACKNLLKQTKTTVFFTWNSLDHNLWRRLKEINWSTKIDVASKCQVHKKVLIKCQFPQWY